MDLSMDRSTTVGLALASVKALPGCVDRTPTTPGGSGRNLNKIPARAVPALMHRSAAARPARRRIAWLKTEPAVS
jgi:hypothetical protein